MTLPETSGTPAQEPDPPPRTDHAMAAGPDLNEKSELNDEPEVEGEPELNEESELNDEPDLNDEREFAGEPEQGWDRVEVITALRAASARQRDAEIDQLALIAAAADVYSWIDNTTEITTALTTEMTAELAAAGAGAPPASVLHGERLWHFGAEGTPEVAEFLTLEVGPALGVSPESAALLIGDVLDLRHRLPRTWKLTLAGRVRIWVARKIAHAASRAELDLDTTHELDRHIAPFLPGWTPHQAFARVDMLIAQLDPERAEARRREALQRRFIAITAAEAGTAQIAGQVDGLGGLALDTTLNELAEVIALGGHHGGHDELRALALETLADPTRAADLLTGTLFSHHTEPGDASAAAGPGNAGRADAPTGGCSRADEAGPDSPQKAAAQDEGLDRANDRVGADLAGGAEQDPTTVPFGMAPQPRIGVLKLDLRLTAADLIAGAGGQSPQLGEVVGSHLQALIAAAAKVIIQPILDPTAPLAADTYAIPDRIRRCVTALYPQVAFPYSNRSSTGAHVDLDHITVWPDGPTDNANLAPLDRRSHRAKTFAGYKLRPVRVGILHWTTPTGQEYWLTPHGTYDYHPETAPTRAAGLAELARNALRRSNTSTAEKNVRDRLATQTLQPVLLPHPEPPLHWHGDNKPPTRPSQAREQEAPPF